MPFKSPLKTTILLLLCASSVLLADTVKIGLILPLTGNNAQIGRPQLNAVELFKKDGQSRKYRHTYEVIVEDDQLMSRLSAQVANKLLNVDKVDGIVAFSSGTGNVLAPQTKAKGVPHIAIASDGKIADGKTNFINWTKPESEVKAWIQLAKRQGAKRVAIFSLRHQGVMAILKSIHEEIKGSGLKIVSDEIFNPGERDFRTQLARIKETNPDTFLPLAFSPEMEIILRQSKELGFTPKISTMECFDFISEPALAEGLYYVSGATGSDDFSKRLLAATGVPAGYCMAYTYDSLDLLRQAYETMDKPDHAQAAAWIARLKNHPSSVGPLTTDTKGIIDSAPAYFQLINGRPVPTPFDKIK